MESLCPVWGGGQLGGMGHALWGGVALFPQDPVCAHYRGRDEGRQMGGRWVLGGSQIRSHLEMTEPEMKARVCDFRALTVSWNGPQAVQAELP